MDPQQDDHEYKQYWGYLQEQNEIKLSIIGGGAGAVMVLHYLVKHIGDPSRLKATIFEAKNPKCRGNAWWSGCDELISNSPVQHLGPSDEEIRLFEEKFAEMKHPAVGQEYPPRNAIGDILEQIQKKTEEDLAQNVEWVQEEVIKIHKHTRTVKTSTGKQYGSDIIILATGNMPLKVAQNLKDRCGNGRVIRCWDQRCFKDIEKEASVLISGASLSSIDSTLLLKENGFQGRIVWHSPSGKLPFVRPKRINLEAKYLSPENLKREIKDGITHEEVFDLTVREYNYQADKTLGWSDDRKSRDLKTLFTAFELEKKNKWEEFLKHGIEISENKLLWYSIVRLFDEITIPLIWNAFSPGERKRHNSGDIHLARASFQVFFQKFGSRLFDRYWSPIPPENAVKLMGWIRRSSPIELEVWYAGGEKDESGNIVYYEPIDGKGVVLKNAVRRAPFASENFIVKKQRQEFDYLILAQGIIADFGKIDSPLLTQLMSDHIVNFVDPTTLSVDLMHGQLKDACGEGQPWIYTLTGSLTKGVVRYPNSFMAVSISAENTAKHIASHINKGHV